MKLKHKEVKLFSGYSGKTHVSISAKVTDGKLCISGYDVGEAPERYMGNSDYEYWYSLDAENTEKFFSLMSWKDFKKNFSGLDACEKFRTFCTKNLISYQFFSY